MRTTVVLTLMLLAVPGLAQEGPTVLQFSFSNPGARSLGLAGAFVALADDATAAFANPAGLVQLTSREVSIEGRAWSYSTPYTAGGRILGPPSGFGLDTSRGLVFEEVSADLQGLSYLSFVQPFEWGSLALYRHQLANFEAETRIEGLFGTDLPGFPGITRSDDVRTKTDLEVVTYGVAGGVRIREGLSLGFGLSYNQVDLTSSSESFTVVDTFESFFGPTHFAPEALRQRADLSTSDSDVTLNLGLRWEFSPQWSIGAVYRMGLSFDLDVGVGTGPRNDFGVPAGLTILETVDDIDFPDVLGLGVAYRSRGGAVTASFEWDRVGYSRIVDSLDPTFFNKVDLSAGDADELRLGVEYALLRSKPLVALRAGAWLDPDHRFQITGTRRSLQDQAVFQPGEDQLHVSAGVGVAFESFQLDLGIDLSDEIDTFALSAIYSF